MNKLFFEITTSGYLIKCLDGSSSPSESRTFKSREIGILWIENRFPNQFEFIDRKGYI